MGDYWTDNNINKPQQRVVCAANKVGDVLLCGARHCDKVMRAQANAMGVSMTTAEQGFIDQFGDFLTRNEALEVATAARQPINMIANGSDTELFSEGLY